MIKPHQQFTQKYGLNFPLLADTEKDDQSLRCRWWRLYKRVTYVIDGNGKNHR